VFIANSEITLQGMNQADLSKLVSALRIAVKPKPRLFASPEGPAGRLRKLKATVTALVKYERIELNYPRAEEAQGYAERVITLFLHRYLKVEVSDMISKIVFL
jgi:large subunit ribosomal protein L17